MHQSSRSKASVFVLLLGAAMFAGCVGNQGGDDGPLRARFTPPIDLAACNAGNATLSLGAVAPDLNGEFSDTWPSSAAARVDVNFQVTPTTFFGTLKCSTSSANGVMSGTLDSQGYVGRYSFGAQTGNVSLEVFSNGGNNNGGNDNGGCGQQGCYQDCQGPNCGGNNCGPQGCYQDCQGSNCGGNNCGPQGCYQDCQGPNCSGNNCGPQGCYQDCQGPNCGGNNQGCCDGPTTSSSPPWSPAGIWTISFSPPLDISSCETSLRSINSQTIQVPPSGTFGGVWESTLSYSGWIDSPSFTASLRCANPPPSGGNPTGGLQGQRSGDGYVGQYNHYGIRGQLTVARSGSAPTTSASSSASPSPTPSAPPSTTTPTSTTPSTPALPQGWSTRADMPVALTNPHAGAVGSNLYVAGGSGPNSVSSVLYVYDSTRNVWTTRSPMPDSRYGGGSAVLDGQLYVIGGQPGRGGAYGSQTAWRYDPSSNAWSTLEAPPRMVSCGNAAASGGKVYLVSPCDPGTGSYRRDLFVYDPASNQWSELPGLPVAHALGGMAALEGIVYVVGGWVNRTNITDTLDAYDPLTNAWTPRASMPAMLETAVAFPLAGKLYVMGGSREDGPTPSLFIYDPGRDEWSTAPTPPTCGPGGVIAGVFYAVSCNSDTVLYRGLKAFVP